MALHPTPVSRQAPTLPPRYRVDPICTFIFSFLVLCTTYGTMKEATHALMAGVPVDVDAEDVMVS
jgi:zinc transporter 2